MLRRFTLILGIALAVSAHASCPNESRVAHIRSIGVEVSKPLTVAQVEALTQTGREFAGLPGQLPYGPSNSEWQELKAKQRTGDYFVQFWRGRHLVERTKFYMDGLYLVRSGCVVGWLKGAVS